MKFGLRDMMLVFTLFAVFSVMLSGNHHQQSMGRHLLYLVSVIPLAVFVGYWLSRPKEAGATQRDWRYLRLRCAMGALVGAVLYTAAVWMLRGQLITTPPFTHQYDFTSIFSYQDRLVWREAICLLPLSLALGATVAPLLILLGLKVELDEKDQRNRNTSLVLLGLVILSWLLAMIDGWQRSYMGSRWLKIMAILIPVMVLFTFSWIENVFRSLNRWAATEQVISQEMTDEVSEPRSQEKPD